MLGRNTSAGRTSGLSRLEFFAVRDSPADLLYDLSERCSHGHLYKSGIMDLSAQGKHFRSFRLLCSHRCEPLRSVDDDLRDVRISLHVV